MENSETFKALMGIISPFIRDKSLLEDINGETHLLNDLRINSAYLIDLVFNTEAYFGIRIDDESIDKMTTVGACVKIIDEKLQAKVNR